MQGFTINEPQSYPKTSWEYATSLKPTLSQYQSLSGTYILTSIWEIRCIAMILHIRNLYGHAPSRYYLALQHCTVIVKTLFL